jgi:hypothetical protein
LTAFSFKIPIKIIRKEDEEEIILVYDRHEEKNCLNIKVNRLVGSERPIPDIVVDYLEPLILRE